MLRVIEPAEVLEHHAALLGRESAQLVPRRVAEFGTAAGRAWEERGRDVDAIGAGCGAAGALLLLDGLIAREGATGVEQLAIQPLLPLDGSGVQPAPLELPRELARFLRQRAAAARAAARLPTHALVAEAARPPRSLTEPFTQ